MHVHHASPTNSCPVPSSFHQQGKSPLIHAGIPRHAGQQAARQHQPSICPFGNTSRAPTKKTQCQLHALCVVCTSSCPLLIGMPRQGKPPGCDFPGISSATQHLHCRQETWTRSLSPAERSTDSRPRHAIRHDRPREPRMAESRDRAVPCWVQKAWGVFFHLPDHAVCEPMRAQERCSIVCRHTHVNTVHRRFCFERSFVHCSAGSLAGFFCVVLLRVVKPTPEQQILNPLQSQFAGSCISRCPLPRSMVSTHTTQTSRPSRLRRRFMASQTGGKCCVTRHASLFREASATQSESRTGFPRIREVFENRVLRQPCRVELTFSP